MMDVPVVFACVGAEPVRQYLRELERTLRMVDILAMYKALSEGKQIEAQLGDSKEWRPLRISVKGNRLEAFNPGVWWSFGDPISAWREKRKPSKYAGETVSKTMAHNVGAFVCIWVPGDDLGKTFRYVIEEMVDE